MRKIKVSIYEDNKPLRDSLSVLINSLPEFELLEAYPNAINIISNTEKKTPEVILMDISMPGINGIEATKQIKNHFPGIRIVMQTVFDDSEKAFCSICAGAVGYLFKKSPPADIIDTIRQSANGCTIMSPDVAKSVLKLFHHQIPSGETVNLDANESDILVALTNGLNFYAIANQMNIDVDVVQNHMVTIYNKLHTHSNTEEVLKTLQARFA